ncbi:hypothetical protein GCM10009687_25970 [Asanoa iriomotensis]|uniref:Uncharacterized protein n=1 Tax=Asanoa iriomotensis TaxID=234613 RepID=A0ABQ4CEI9_9ACTN|nr:hypothetical protein Air01nite_72840 [Asanoa iriomotensis]
MITLLASNRPEQPHTITRRRPGSAASDHEPAVANGYPVLPRPTRCAHYAVRKRGSHGIGQGVLRHAPAPTGTHMPRRFRREHLDQVASGRQNAFVHTNGRRTANASTIEGAKQRRPDSHAHVDMDTRHRASGPITTRRIAAPRPPATTDRLDQVV